MPNISLHYRKQLVNFFNNLFVDFFNNLPVIFLLIFSTVPLYIPFKICYSVMALVYVPNNMCP